MGEIAVLVIEFISFVLFFTQIKVIVSENTTEECAFVKSNRDIQLTMSKIFKLLKVSENITDKFTVKLCLGLNKHFIRFAELEMKTYEEISNACKADINIHKNSTYGKVFEVDEIINKMCSEYFATLMVKAKKRKRSQVKLTTVEGTTKSKSNFKQDNYNIDSSEVSLDFVKDFLHKIDKLTVEDILGPYNKSQEMEIMKTMSKILKKEKTLNLKKWDPPDSSEESNLNLTRRLYKGDPTTVQSYPFMVSIHVNGVFVCGGSIISRDLIITSASCLQIAHNNGTLAKKPSLFVRVASDFTNKLGVLLPITKVYFHPEFEPKHLRNNLAIAQVDEMINIKDKKIRRIPFERRARWSATEGTTLKMLGWGDTAPDKKNQGDPLSMTRLEIYNFKECRERYTGTFVTTDNYCGGFTNRGGGACNRDIGGPSIVRGALTGVISFGPPVCGTPDGPTVFTDVTSYLDWIDTVLRNVHAYSQHQDDVYSTTKAFKESPISQHREKPLRQQQEKSNTLSSKNEILKPRSRKSKQTHNTNAQSLSVPIKSDVNWPAFPENIRLIETAFKAGVVMDGSAETDSSSTSNDDTAVDTGTKTDLNYPLSIGDNKTSNNASVTQITLPSLDFFFNYDNNTSDDSSNSEDAISPFITKYDNHTTDDDSRNADAVLPVIDNYDNNTIKNISNNDTVLQLIPNVYNKTEDQISSAESVQDSSVEHVANDLTAARIGLTKLNRATAVQLKKTTMINLKPKRVSQSLLREQYQNKPKSIKPLLPIYDKTRNEITTDNTLNPRVTNSEEKLNELSIETVPAEKTLKSNEHIHWITDAKVLERLKKADDRNTLQKIIEETYGDEYEIEYVIDGPINNSVLKKYSRGRDFEDKFYYESGGSKEVNQIDNQGRVVTYKPPTTSRKLKTVSEDTPNIDYNASILDALIESSEKTQNIDKQDKTMTQKLPPKSKYIKKIPIDKPKAVVESKKLETFYFESEENKNINHIDEKGNVVVYKKPERSRYAVNSDEKDASDNFETVLETDQEGISIEVSKKWNNESTPGIIPFKGSLRTDNILLNIQMNLLSSQNNLYGKNFLSKLGLR